MKTLRKRLVCANRGQSVEQQNKNRAAMDKVQERYLSKMRAKGWEIYQDGQISEGNVFFKWERYITIYKLKSR